MVESERGEHERVVIDDEALGVAIGNIALKMREALVIGDYDTFADWSDEEKRLMNAKEGKGLKPLGS